jgi:hypothetical protein
MHSRCYCCDALLTSAEERLSLTDLAEPTCLGCTQVVEAEIDPYAPVVDGALALAERIA